MRSKIKKLLITIIPVSLGLAVCAGAVVHNLTKESPIETNGISATTNQTIYLDPQGGWGDASAKFAIYAYGSSSNRWSSLMSTGTSDTDISGVYKVTMDLTSMTTIIVCRMSSSTTESTVNWSNKWNQTGNITIASISDKDLFKGTGLNGDSSTGTWYKTTVKSSTMVTLNLVVSSTNLNGGTPTAYAFGAPTYTQGVMAWPGVAMSNVSGDLYTAQVSSTYANVIFNNNNNGRQSVDLTIDNFIRNVVSGYGVSFKISSYDSGTGKYVGVWDQSGDITNTFPTFNKNYMRIWLNRNGNFDNGTYFYAIHFWNTDAAVDVEIMPRGYQNFSNGGSWYFAYYDVPVAYTGYNIQFKVYTNATGAFASVSTASDVTYTDGDNAMIYKIQNSSGTYTYSREVIGASANDVPADSYVKVMEGYLTCYNNKNNGYGNFGQVSTTWIKNGSTVYVVGGVSALSAVTMSDFASKATSDYDTGANRTSSTTVLNKYTEMAIMYNAVAGDGYQIQLGNEVPYEVVYTDYSTSGYVVLGIVAIVSVSLVLVYAFVVLKKHHKEEN